MAFAILGLAGCADETSTSAKAAKKDVPVPAAAPTTAPNIKIDALGDVRPDQARLLAVLIRQNMSANPAYDIIGALDAAPMPTGLGRTYVVAVIDLKDAGGARLHRFIDDETIDRPGGGPLVQADIARLADKLSTKLAGWRSATPMNFALDETLRTGPEADDMATGGIRREAHETAASSKLRFDIAMGPAPDDGTQALASALASALTRRAPSTDWGCGCYRLRGEIALASAEDGRASLTIGWLIISNDGRPLGKVTQIKTLDPESIAGHWSGVAEEAAEEAADGVLAVILPDGGKGASGT